MVSAERESRTANSGSSVGLLETVERATVTVSEAARILGIGRSAAYAAAASGTLPGAIRIGRRVVVSRMALERVLRGQ